jgi:Ankyrin repeats (3 copies)
MLTASSFLHCNCFMHNHTLVPTAVLRDLPQVVEWLVQKKAMLEKVTNAGRTAAFHAATGPPNKRIECLRLLLAAGADPNKQDALGSTLLLEAAESGSVQKVKLLLAHGADGALGTCQSSVYGLYE